MTALPFDLPVPPGASAVPAWTGTTFSLGDDESPVLEYSQNLAGWSDDLIALHEQTAGNHHPIDLASRRDAVRQVAIFLPAAGATIMEIGCSSGFLLQDLRSSFPKAVIVGVDVLKDPLYRLSKTMPGIPLIRFDLLQCPLPPSCVDVIVMLNVFEHIDDDLSAMRNVFSILKPGGVLICEVPAGAYLYNSYDADLNHYRRYSAQQFSQKLQAAGFSICRLTHLGCLLFLAFAATKLLGKLNFLGRKRPQVGQRIVRTSDSKLLKIALNFEARYLSKTRLPFGIRALAVARHQL